MNPGQCGQWNLSRCPGPKSDLRRLLRQQSDRRSSRGRWRNRLHECSRARSSGQCGQWNLSRYRGPKFDLRRLLRQQSDRRSSRGRWRNQLHECSRARSPGWRRLLKPIRSRAPRVGPSPCPCHPRFSRRPKYARRRGRYLPSRLVKIPARCPAPSFVHRRQSRRKLSPRHLLRRLGLRSQLLWTAPRLSPLS